MRDVDGADDDHAERRVVDGEKVSPSSSTPERSMRKRSGTPRAGKAAVPCGEIHHVGHGAAVGAGVHEGFREVERKGLAQRFDQDADGAAAGEADGESLVVADAVGQQAGLAILQRPGRLDDDRASTQPPETEPAISPSPATASWLPTGREGGPRSPRRWRAPRRARRGAR